VLQQLTGKLSRPVNFLPASAPPWLQMSSFPVGCERKGRCGDRSGVDEVTVQGEGLKGFRGPVLHFLGDPLTKEPESSYEYFEDGLLVVSPDGIVVACLEATVGIERYRGDLELVDCSGKVQPSRGYSCRELALLFHV
jgi:hypothetical protein